MAIMMEQNGGYPESPMEPDDAIYPCKGCGEILEEGKAFELAGNRWHIDCFRCNTCGTILDSDANLLLLGDGSLICNNCTYSCSVCANKIEDLAILTGDQAFCANCFKCRNCKKKIENLKYARTSQGIFCMECHESLMARRRKKTQKSAAARQKANQQNANNGMLLDKSLPSLPPSAVDRAAIERNLALSPDQDSPMSESFSEAPGDAAATQRQQRPANTRSRSDQEQGKQSRRPPHPRSNSDQSENAEQENGKDDEAKGRSNSATDDFFIPMKLDTNPAPGPSPLGRREAPDSRSPQHDAKPNSRDYFNARNAALRNRTTEDVLPRYPLPDSTTGSRNSSQPSSPHIAYQERGRQLSSDLSPEFPRRRQLAQQQQQHAPHHGHTNNASLNAIAKESVREQQADSRARRNEADSAQNGGRFMLQEVPKQRKSEKRNSKGETVASRTKSASVSASGAPVKEQQVILPTQSSPDSSQSNQTLSGSPHDMSAGRSGASAGSQTSPLAAQVKNVPERGDSLAKPGPQFPPRKPAESGGSGKLSGLASALDDHNDKPASAPPTATQAPPPALSNHRNANRTLESPSKGHFNETPPHPPQRAKERLAAQRDDVDSHLSPHNLHYSSKHDTHNHEPASPYVRDREPASSPYQSIPRDREPASSRYVRDREGDAQAGEAPSQDEQGFLRRVSSSVRHARSYSDRGTRTSQEPRWGIPKSPLPDARSPSFGSPVVPQPEVDRLRKELELERQRSAEFEAALDAKSSIKQMNSELKEKRSTIVVLDTQKEMVVRELEILTAHIAATQKSGEPLDVGKMTSSVLREFAQSLQSLKDSFQPQIEDLLQKRNDLSDEVSNVTQQKEKTLQEFEQLTLKNAQLADLNNQLVHQVQELYKANASDAVRPPNGIAIHAAQMHKDRGGLAVLNDGREQRPSISDSTFTGSTVLPEQDVENPQYLPAPQVVNIRKAQPKKFNWKKGGHNMAKGVKIGLKGAFSSENRAQRDGSVTGTEGIPYGAMAQQEYPRTDSYSKASSGGERGAGLGGLFGKQQGRPAQGWKNSPNHSYAAVNSDGQPLLFGSELEIRAEYERSNIPNVVIRCIQEVDARGIDIEGIYRKSGGSGQVQVIREGFERSKDYDISDPDLDINAVTSCLKQYFRKLPTPLITFDVYEKLLDSVSSQQGEYELSHPAHPQNPNNHAFRVNSMRQAINDLPPHHRDTLEVLVFHLARVIEHAEENLMTSSNVAVVFAPTIMRPESLAREMQDTQAKNAAVQFMIDNCQGVFLASPGPVGQQQYARNSNEGRAE